jgi:hypothetical protein
MEGEIAVTITLSNTLFPKKGINMRTSMKARILCTGLTLFTQGRAQFAEPAGTPLPATQNPSGRVAARYDYFASNLVSNREEWPKPEAGLPTGLRPSNVEDFRSKAALQRACIGKRARSIRRLNTRCQIKAQYISESAAR